MATGKLRVRCWQREIWSELSTNSGLLALSFNSIGKSARKDAGEPQAGMPALPCLLTQISFLNPRIVGEIF